MLAVPLPQFLCVINDLSHGGSARFLVAKQFCFDNDDMPRRRNIKIVNVSLCFAGSNRNLPADADKRRIFDANLTGWQDTGVFRKQLLKLRFIKAAVHIGDLFQPLDFAVCGNNNGISACALTVDHIERVTPFWFCIFEGRLEQLFGRPASPTSSR